MTSSTPQRRLFFFFFFLSILVLHLQRQYREKKGEGRGISRGGSERKNGVKARRIYEDGLVGRPAQVASFDGQGACKLRRRKNPREDFQERERNTFRWAKPTDSNRKKRFHKERGERRMKQQRNTLWRREERLATGRT